MKLYGTTTSPFVRRVRVVAAEVGEPIERIDTAGDAGQAVLREVSPIRKVPVAIASDRTLFDSRVIIEWLIGARGWGGLAQPADRWDDLNRLNAIDAALDGIIQIFYLRQSGIAVDGTPYAERQLARADAIFAWLAAQPGLGEHFGLVEISAICALDWMDFRNTYPTERAGLERLRAAWRDRPSLASTRPHG